MSTVLRSKHTASLILVAAVSTAFTQGLQYEVNVEWLADPTVDPERQTDAVILDQRLHSRATPDDAERNRQLLISSFQELSLGFQRSGTTKVFLSGEISVVMHFAPLVGVAGGTSPILEYFDGETTLLATGKLRSDLPNPARVFAGDQRETFTGIGEAMVFFNKEPPGQLARTEVINGTTVTHYATKLHGHDVRFQVERKGGLIERVTVLANNAGLLGDVVEVISYTQADNRTVPAEVSITRRRQGKTVVIERYRFLKGGLPIPRLGSLLPVGTPIIDSRGSADVTYRWSGDFPDESSLIAQRSSGNKRISGASSLLLGGGLIMLGLALVIRKR